MQNGSTVSLAVGNSTARKSDIAVEALRDCRRIETSAHVRRIVTLELGPRVSVQDFTLW